MGEPNSLPGLCSERFEELSPCCPWDVLGSPSLPHKTPPFPPFTSGPQQKGAPPVELIVPSAKGFDLEVPGEVRQRDSEQFLLQGH